MTNQTAVAKREEKAPIVATGKVAAITATTAEEAMRLANALAQANDMVPRNFQGKPMEIMAAILRGAEVGLAPMQALSNIAVINGRAILWGDALPALMQRAGHHVDVKVEGDGDKAVAIATLTRGDTGRTIERRFSMADAKRAGLLGKQGPWSQYPTRMLSHRARAWAIRDGAADALMGLGISDEVEDYRGPDAAKDVTPRHRRFAFKDAPEPESIAEPDADTAEIVQEPDDAQPSFSLDDDEADRIAAEVRDAANREAGNA